MLDGVEVIVDTTNAGTTNGVKAAAFFTDVTGRLHAAGAAAGVAQLVTLSITGIGCVPGYGYYQAKLALEQAAFAGPAPATVVRRRSSTNSRPGCSAGPDSGCSR